MLEPDSDAAKTAVGRVNELAEKLADAEMRAINNRAEIERLTRFLDFAILWTTREKVTDAERVNVIRFHPVAQARIKSTG